MIKCEVIEQFTLKDFDKLTNVTRAHAAEKGTLFVGDTFECSKKMADYLTGKNEQNKTVVKIIQVEPLQSEKAEVLKEAYIKTAKKKTSKK